MKSALRLLQFRIHMLSLSKLVHDDMKQASMILAKIIKLTIASLNELRIKCYRITCRSIVDSIQKLNHI